MKIGEELEKIGCKSLTEDEQKHVRECLEQARRDIEEHERRSIVAPKIDFVSSAIAAGFTEAQAEFLWAQRPRSEWRA
jgi:hypothetical protein